MKSLKYIFIIITSVVALNSCHRDELCYMHTQGAQIVVLADWQTKARIDPNAATLMIYNADNNRLISEIRMPNPDRHILDLPVGRYSIVIFNETLTGSTHDETVGYRNWNQFEAFEVYNKDDYSKNGGTFSYKISPDTIAVDRRIFYEVTQDMIDKNHIHPAPQNSTDSRSIADTIRFIPPRVISVTNITLEVIGLQYIASYKASLHGMSESYFLGINKYSTHPISHPVSFTSLSRSVTDIKVDTLYASMSTIGLAGNTHPLEAGAMSYIFDLSITLVNGDKHFFTWDLVEEQRIALIREADHAHPNDFININLNIEIPQVLGAGNGLDADLTDWHEHIVDLNTTTLQFNSNGGSGVTSPIRRSYNTKFALPVSTFYPPIVNDVALTFKEWNTKSNGTGISYHPDDLYTMPRGGEVLYAIWQNNNINK